VAEDEDKVRVYLERSKSSPIDLSLYRRSDAFSHDPFFQITPLVVGRLESLYIEGTPENLQQITAHLSHPAPLLEWMGISGGCEYVTDYPRLTPTLFNGDLSSLHYLSLEAVCTGLPWRDMINLTSFALDRMPPGEISITQLLDFFESAPHLSDISLYSTALATGVQGGRSVSLACLKRMRITDHGLPSVLLDHLLIPVGAELILDADLLHGSLIGDILPRSLGNLRNMSNFTAIRLSDWEAHPSMEFGGPNGKVRIYLISPQHNRTRLMLESLTQFDTSGTRRLEIGNTSPLSRGPLCQVLLPMKGLRVLVLYECYSPHIFIHALHPSAISLEVVVCPKLEELVLVLRDDVGAFDMEDVIEMAKARASKGKRLETIRIADRGDISDPGRVLELRKHVGHVEHTREYTRAIEICDE